MGKLLLGIHLNQKRGHGCDRSHGCPDIERENQPSERSSVEDFSFDASTRSSTMLQ